MNYRVFIIGFVLAVSTGLVSSAIFETKKEEITSKTKSILTSVKEKFNKVDAQ